jgi:hypothetical protein
VVNLAVYPETVWSISWLHYITLHSLDPKLVKMAAGCGTISAPIYANAIAELYLRYVLCNYLFRVYSLQAVLVIDPSSGASTGVSANSLQLAGIGNMLKCFICIDVSVYRRYLPQVCYVAMLTYCCFPTCAHPCCKWLGFACYSTLSATEDI